MGDQLALLLPYNSIGDHVPNPRHARELEPKVLDGEGFRQTEHQRPLQMGTGGFIFAPAKDDVVIVQPVTLLATRILMVPNPHSPNVKVLGVAGAPTTTEEAESHLDSASGCDWAADRWIRIEDLLCRNTIARKSR